MGLSLWTSDSPLIATRLSCCLLHLSFPALHALLDADKVLATLALLAVCSHVWKSIGLSYALLGHVQISRTTGVLVPSGSHRSLLKVTPPELYLQYNIHVKPPSLLFLLWKASVLSPLIVAAFWFPFLHLHILGISALFDFFLH